MSSSEGQTLSSRDPTSGDRARSPRHGWGSLHLHSRREHRHPQPPTWAKPRVSMKCWGFSVREGGSEDAGGRQRPLPTSLWPHGEILTLPTILPAACAHPCSSSPKCWDRSSRRSTGYMSSSSNFHLWPILNKGFSHLLNIKGEWHIFKLHIFN